MKAVPWKTIKSKSVFTHPRISLVEDVVELPDGKLTTYIKQTPSAVYSVLIVAINDKQEMLLQKEYSYPPDEVLWQLPGGDSDGAEDIIVAANRELSEESGFVGKQCQLLGSYVIDNRRSDKIQHVVLCRDLVVQTAERDEEEFIESHWIPIANLRTYIRNGEFKNACLLAALNVYFTSVEHITES